MWERILEGLSQLERHAGSADARSGRKTSRAPHLESLEERRLMTASLASIPSLIVPTTTGQQIILDGTGTTDDQTFTVTSSNPDVAATVATGPIWTVGVNYTDTTAPSSDFTGNLVFQLFSSVAPNAVNNIQTFSNDGDYVNTYKWFSRIANGFPDSSGYIVQGGSPNQQNTSQTTSPPGTPIANENSQSVTFNGSYVLAMANSSATTPSNNTQFFITTENASTALGYNYTIFGQLLSGQAVISKMIAVPLVSETSPIDSAPENPLSISSATITQGNPSGTLLLDTTQAQAGETSTITITAHDATDNTTTQQQFNVTVGPYSGPTQSSLIQTINFKPFANATTAATASATPTTVTLNGQGTYPISGSSNALVYTLTSQPVDGTVSNFNASTGTFTYTPKASFAGKDTFDYSVSSTGPNTTYPAATSNSGVVTVTVGAAPVVPEPTGAVRVVGNNLIITPLPRSGHHLNQIYVSEVPDAAASGGAVIQVDVNGQLDVNQPAITAIDRIIVFGSRTNDRITLDPSVTIPATLDGGHGGTNVLKSGGGETLELGWFGRSTLIGGSGSNQLVGKAGQVKFKPTKTTNLIFAGVPKRRTSNLHATPPGGTFYEYKGGKLIPVPLKTVESKV